jgi:hypothetical protein
MSTDIPTPWYLRDGLRIAKNNMIRDRAFSNCPEDRTPFRDSNLQTDGTEERSNVDVFFVGKRWDGGMIVLYIALGGPGGRSSSAHAYSRGSEAGIYNSFSSIGGINLKNVLGDEPRRHIPHPRH